MRRALSEMLRALDRYWFGYGSPVSLGIVRIAIGALIVFKMLILSGQFSDWFTEQGFVPQSVAKTYFQPPGRDLDLAGLSLRLPFDFPRVNVYSQITDTRVTAAVFWLTTLAAFLTALGLWTRASAIAAAVGVVSLHHRNGLILHGGDTVLRVMALYLAISPCGKACSLDRVIALWKGRAQPGPPPDISLWPQRLIVFNVALIYFTTVWHKWTGTVWREGLGTWFPARLNEFKRFPVPEFLNELPFVYFTSFGTLLTELALATLVFYRPLRKWVLLAGVLMHAYIEYAMNIPLFSFAMVSLYVAFYEGEEVSAWARRWAERFRTAAVTVLTPAGIRIKPGPAAALSALDPLDLVRYESGEEDKWHAADALGRPKRPFAASALRSFGAWTFVWIPGLWRKLHWAALEGIQNRAAAEKSRPMEQAGDRR